MHFNLFDFLPSCPIQSGYCLGQQVPSINYTQQVYFETTPEYDTLRQVHFPHSFGMLIFIISDFTYEAWRFSTECLWKTEQ